jgi:hypothetical protein
MFQDEVSWVMMLCSVVIGYQYFGGPCMEAAWTSEMLVSYYNHYKASQPKRPQLEMAVVFCLTS